MTDTGFGSLRSSDLNIAYLTGKPGLGAVGGVYTFVYTFREVGTAIKFRGMIISVAPSRIGDHKGLVDYRIQILGTVTIPKDTAFEIVGDE